MNAEKNTLESIISLYEEIKDLPDLKLQAEVLETKLEEFNTESIQISENNHLIKQIENQIKEVNIEIEKLELKEKSINNENFDSFINLKKNKIFFEDEFEDKILKYLQSNIKTFSIRCINDKQIDLQKCISANKKMCINFEKTPEIHENFSNFLNQFLEKISEINEIFEDENNFYFLGFSLSGEIETCKNLQNVKQISNSFFYEENTLRFLISDFIKKIERKMFVEEKKEFEKIKEIFFKFFDKTAFQVINLDEWAVTSLVRHFIDNFKKRDEILIRKTVHNQLIKQISSQVFNLCKIFEKIKEFETERTEKIKQTKIKTIRKLFSSTESFDFEKFVTFFSDNEFFWLEGHLDGENYKEFNENIITLLGNFMREKSIFENNEDICINLIKKDFSTLTTFMNEINGNSQIKDFFLRILNREIIQNLKEAGTENFSMMKNIMHFLEKLFEKNKSSEDFQNLLEIKKLFEDENIFEEKFNNFLHEK